MNKKQLYESIMKNVAIEVKKALNEADNAMQAVHNVFFTAVYDHWNGYTEEYQGENAELFAVSDVPTHISNAKLLEIMLCRPNDDVCPLWVYYLLDKQWDNFCKDDYFENTGMNLKVTRKQNYDIDDCITEINYDELIKFKNKVKY